MNLSHGMKLGAWILIFLNLGMALGSIWIFNRMSPAIEKIIKQNQRSLFASERMLIALATPPLDSLDQSILIDFQNALNDAKSNITESGESEILDDIESYYQNAIREKDPVYINLTLEAIQKLSHVNQQAMLQEDQAAQRLGRSGAWGIMLMATLVFWVRMLFMRRVNKNLLQPLQELHSVFSSHKNGNRLRRCSSSDQPDDLRFIFNGVNELLDEQDFKN